MSFRFPGKHTASFCFITAITLIFASTASAQFDDPFGGGGFGGQAVSGSISISISDVNGVKTTQVNDNGQRFTFLESAEDGITVKLTKQYGPDDMDALQKDHPDLFMHIQSFPTESGDAKVELTINILSEHQAQNVEDLKKDHPEAFKVYQKYTKQRRGGIRRAVPADPFKGGADPFGPDDAEEKPADEKDSDVDI